MRITPLEIRQHTFDKSFRGYDTESVDAFLLSLSQEWERVAEEVRVTKQQLDKAEQEVNRVKEIETSLFKTLKVAEDAQKEINDKAYAEAAKIVDEAKVEATKIIENARIEADAIANEARRNANITVTDAESKATYLVEDADNKLKSFERDTKALERYKDLLVQELKKFATDTLDKVAKFEERTSVATVVEPSSIDVPIEPITEPVPEQAHAVPLATEVATDESPAEELPLVEFEPANDFDDENDELPTVSAIVHNEEKHLAEPSDRDDEEAELPTLSAILQQDFMETTTLEYETTHEEAEAEESSKEETSTIQDNTESLIKEAKSTKRPKKLTDGKDLGLPTVSSVMEEFKKDNPGSINNGGGSFFDSF
ncbi:DivIVA domain-containing protein [Flectobacillus major]|uniref:DivIVA domain-containing protein n=1 Tax=Flectobacillus major TaxID=103 RepID=UPI00041C201F|nr:DivIVA domain-containing protein [Flectobacillus major]